MAPKFRIRADILAYTTLLGISTLGALAFTEVYGVSEEDKLKNLREKYPVQTLKNENQRQQMQVFFDKMKSKEHSDLDDKFNGILRAGKGEMKRHHAYDRNDAGTEHVQPGKSSGSGAVVTSSKTGKTTTNGGVVADQKNVEQTQSQTPKAAGSWWGWW